METTDLLIVGGGIIGLTVAREAKLRWPDQRVVVVEKESDVAQHASGRNSGVLHAGFYYHPDSLKARLTSNGNRQMRDFCAEHGLRVNHCGKLVVATSPGELAVLSQLYDRGIANGVALELVDEKQALEIEPRARTVEKAIFSPDTCSVDPIEVTREMARECQSLGVTILTEETFLSGTERSNQITVSTSKGKIATGRLVNCAGLYADRIAKVFGVGNEFIMQPFKGLYLYADESFGTLRTHVYPVPDIRNPFLGVHFTIASDDRIKIGPTATPALWREQYQHFDNFHLAELVETFTGLATLLLKPDSTLRKAVPSEIAKYFRRLLVRQAARLIPDITADQFKTWGKPGIRAQLVDKTSHTLVSDFKIDRTERTLHILNAVSPAFTSSIPFAALAIDEVSQLGT